MLPDFVALSSMLMGPFGESPMHMNTLEIIPVLHAQALLCHASAISVPSFLLAKVMMAESRRSYMKGKITEDSEDGDIDLIN